MFVAGDQDERDLWVEYISEGLKKQRALKLQGAVPAADSAPSSASSDASWLGVASPCVDSADACLHTLTLLGPCLISFPINRQQSSEGPCVELVLVKDGTSLAETVRAHELPYGTPLRLARVRMVSDVPNPLHASRLEVSHQFISIGRWRSRTW